MLDLLKFSIAADNRTKPVFDALNGELKGVRGALATVEERAQRLGRSMRNIGLGMSAAVTAPLMLMGRDMLQLYDQQAKAEAAVEQAILSTGGAAGKTADELFGLASAMQRTSLFGDEEILKGATAQLLTFTNIAGKEFGRAQQAVLDIAAAQEKELLPVAMQVGKALNDPAKGLSALTEAGIQFSEEQRKVIESLVQTGDAAAAQSLMLDELERQFAGQAAEAAEAGLGPMQQLGMAIADVKEMLGGEIATFLPSVLEKVEAAVDWFAQLSPEVKSNIVVFGGFAAAAGPVIAALGLTTLGITSLVGATGSLLALVGGAGVAMGALAPPLAIAAGLAAALGGAWLLLRDDMTEAEGAMEAAREAQDALNVAMGTFYETAAPSSAHEAIEAAEANYQLAESAIAAAEAEVAKRRSLLDEARGRSKKGARDNLNAARDDLAEAEAAIEDARRARDRAARAVTGRMSEEMTGAAGATRMLSVEVEGLETALGNAGGAAGALNQAMPEVPDLVPQLNEIDSAAQQVNQQFAGTFSAIVRGAEDAGDALSRLFDRLADRLLTSGFDQLFGEIGLGDIFAPLLGSADGNVFRGGHLVPFADGGIVDGPTLFPMKGRNTGLMGEAGAEAIMPLSRGADGRLGVRAEGGGGGGAVIHQQITVDARGADTGAVERIEASLARFASEFEGRVHEALRRGRNRRNNRSWQD